MKDRGDIYNLISNSWKQLETKTLGDTTSRMKKR